MTDTPTKAQNLDLFRPEHSSINSNKGVRCSIRGKVMPLQAVNDHLQCNPTNRVEIYKFGKSIQCHKNGGVSPPGASQGATKSTNNFCIGRVEGWDVCQPTRAF